MTTYAKTGEVDTTNPTSLENNRKGFQLHTKAIAYILRRHDGEIKGMTPRQIRKELNIEDYMDAAQQRLDAEWETVKSDLLAGKTRTEYLTIDIANAGDEYYTPNYEDVKHLI